MEPAEPQADVDPEDELPPLFIPPPDDVGDEAPAVGGGLVLIWSINGHPTDLLLSIDFIRQRFNKSPSVTIDYQHTQNLIENHHMRTLIRMDTSGMKFAVHRDNLLPFRVGVNAANAHHLKIHEWHTEVTKDNTVFVDPDSDIVKELSRGRRGPRNPRPTGPNAPPETFSTYTAYASASVCISSDHSYDPQDETDVEISAAETSIKTAARVGYGLMGQWPVRTQVVVFHDDEITDSSIPNSTIMMNGEKKIRNYQFVTAHVQRKCVSPAFSYNMMTDDDFATELGAVIEVHKEPIEYLLLRFTAIKCEEVHPLVAILPTDDDSEVLRYAIRSPRAENVFLLSTGELASLIYEWTKGLKTQHDTCAYAIMPHILRYIPLCEPELVTYIVGVMVRMDHPLLDDSDTNDEEQRLLPILRSDQHDLYVRRNWGQVGDAFIYQSEDKMPITPPFGPLDP